MLFEGSSVSSGKNVDMIFQTEDSLGFLQSHSKL